MIPNEARILIPKTFKYITLHSKGDFADVIELRTLRWGDGAGLLGGLSVITGLQKPKREAERSKWCSMRKIQPAVDGFGGGRRGTQAKECGWLLEARKPILPWSFRNRIQPWNQLYFSHWEPCWTSTKLSDSKSVLFQVTKFGMNCYRNNRRLIKVFAFYAWHLSLNILFVLYNIPLHAYTTFCSTIDRHLVVSRVGYCQLCCYEHSCACLSLT